MAGAIRSLIVRIGADFSEMEKGLRAASKKLKTTGKEFGNVGKNLTKGLTVPLVGAATASAKFAADYEDSLAKVATIADTTKISMDDLSKGVKAVSNETGTAATEINEALYQAISAGADTAKAMDLVEVAVKAARGGFTDTATAVDGLTSVLNTYNMETGDAEGLANKFLVTQNKGKTTFGELAQSIGQVAPTASSVGVSIDELLSGVASLTANGIQTSTAMAGLKQTFANIIKPTGDAQKAAAELGIDFSSAALESKGLAGFLADLQEKTGGNIDVMSKLFGSVEALNTVLTLTSDSGMSMMNDTMNEMKTNSTAVEDAFKTVTGTSSEQWKIVLNELKNVSIELGTTLLPLLTELMKGVIQPLVTRIGELAKAFAELSPGQQKAMFALFGLLAAAGPVFTIIGKMTKGLGGFMGALAKGSAAVKGGSGFVGALSAILGPAGLALAAIALIAGIAFVVIKNWEGIKGFFTNLWDGVVSTITSAKDRIVALIDSIKTAFKNLFPVKIKMPKFSVQGSLNPVNWFRQGLPKLSISWNKAGGIFTKPTVLPTMAGLQGFGEAGAEAILPLTRLPGIVAEAMDKKRQEVNHTGTITVRGVNDRGELVAVIEQAITNNLISNDRRIPNRASIVPL